MAQNLTNIVNDPNIKIVKIDSDIGQNGQNGGNNEFISNSMPSTFSQLSNQLGGNKIEIHDTNIDQNQNQTKTNNNNFQILKKLLI